MKTLQLILITLALMGTSYAYTADPINSDGVRAKWAPGTVMFYSDLGGFNSDSTRALADWNQYTGNTYLRSANTTTVGWGDGRNEIYWATDANLNFVWPNNILAITLPNFDWQTGRMIETDIVFNNIYFNWLSYDGPLHGGNVYDIDRVLLHEIGHAIGLGHSTEDAIMGIGNRYTLSADDIAGARFLYGNRSSSVPDTGATAGLLGLGLLTLAGYGYYKRVP